MATVPRTPFLANSRFIESATMPASGHARKITLVLTCPFREVKRLNSQILHNKNAVIYGGGGSLGGAIAKAIAREGATVFLGGRRLAPLKAIVDEIVAAGGRAEAAVVDATNPDAVNTFVD